MLWWIGVFVRLMQLIALRRLLPRSWRTRLRTPWNQLLDLEQSGAERRFYRPFLRAGDLVFDIGAHHGEKCAAFLSLGARVVAVEPNPNGLALLSKRFPREIETGRLIVLPVAVGRSAGRVQLRQFLLDGCNASVSDVFARALEEELGAPSAVFDVEMIAGAGQPLRAQLRLVATAGGQRQHRHHHRRSAGAPHGYCASASMGA